MGVRGGGACVVAVVVAIVVATPRHRSRANKPYSAGVVIHDDDRRD